MNVFPKIRLFLQKREHEFNSIPSDRKKDLQKLGDYIFEKLRKKEKVKLVTVCTHNSRRSHFAQFGLALASAYYTMSDIETFSGGTETTAFHPNAVEAIKRIGVDISCENPTINNPIYLARWNDSMNPYECFSKVYNAKPNPQNNFCAIMVCSHADENCPIVAGADCKIALPFDDPKAFDNTEVVQQKYDASLEHICREMLFVLNHKN